MRTIKGFTLMELVVVMVIVGIIAGIAATTIRVAFTEYFTGVTVTTLNTQALIAMTRISDELQKASSFTTMNATNVTFTTVDGSTITYSWTSPTLSRTVTTARTVNDTITAFSLAYYKSDFTSGPTVTSVRAITITMTLGNGSETVPLINTVYLNNMK